MTTLAVMKQRIADELARADLTSMIAYAVSDAIKHYQSTRWFFNESREITFDTVNGQEFYDKYDNAYIATIMKIDYAKVTVQGTQYTLARTDPEEHESNTTNVNGQPWSYSYYGQQMRLYPVPNQTWEVRIAGHFQYPEPASDTEKYNPWMTEGERLIRARAKLNLVRNVNAAGLEPTFNDKAILIFKDEIAEAERELKSRTNIMTGSGKIKPYGC